MTVGIFGGSFNPVHNGHIALAKALTANGAVDEVWLTLSPLNPLKAGTDSLIADTERLEMLKLAVDGIDGLRVCDIELSMPRPSYTINTLNALTKKFPSTRFRLVIGADNMQLFNQWKAHEEILRNYSPIVYPRPGYQWPGAVDLPLHDISSTHIRQLLREGNDISHLVPPMVANYIAYKRLYV